MFSLTFKTPRAPRTLALAMLVTFQVAGGASAQERSSWDVNRTVEAALARPEVQAMLDARVASMRSDIEQRTQRPNPTLDLDYEQGFAFDSQSLEVSATVRQHFDLTPWRQHLRASIPDREEALRAEVTQRRVEMAAQVRLAFYAVRYHQERLEVVAAWIAQLGRGVALIEARERHGEASLYERRRIEREAQLAGGQYARERAELAAAWSALRTWVEWTDDPQLTGELAPRSPGEERSGPLAGLVRLEHEDRALAAEAKALGSPGWRGWEVGAGYRYADPGLHSGHGLLLTLSFPLALWSTDAPQLARIKAERRRVQTELQLETVRARRAEAAAERRLGDVLLALDEFGVLDDGHDLAQLAELAFAADEASLVELLDAYGSELQLRLTYLDLQWAARQAAIELDLRRCLGVLP